MYNVIFAMDKAGGIGVNGRLPWNIPKELELFKSITGDNPLVASRVTYEGLPKSVQTRVKAVQSSKYSYQKPSFGNLNSATIHIWIGRKMYVTAAMGDTVKIPAQAHGLRSRGPDPAV